uniref:spermatogenesis-associated protein 4-like n=1 Tax=Styela clava TaxID=7725 RepID=UPI00193A95E2|nr:spermatogenesis-associated protein 4-like [Styela clava]
MSKSSNGVPRQCLPREVLKWIQSLDLSYSVRNARRDFANGFLVAEIFSWYYPQDIQMHSYDNGISLPTKLGNWSQLERFFSKKKLDIPKEMIDGTIHCKPGAAELLVQTIYSSLTNRVVRTLESEPPVDFTDGNYQMKLPLHARSTASHSIKNNLKITEFMTEPNIITNKEKAHTIIENHLKRRTLERVEDPARFNIKPTLGEMAERYCPSNNSDNNPPIPFPSGYSERDSKPGSRHTTDTRGSVHFKEVQVRQVDKSSQPSVYPGSYQTAQAV